MSEPQSLFPKAVAEFEKRVTQVGDDQWQSSTPCAEWDVRALVNHLVNENKWVSPLIEGQTIDEVGDAFDGDLLGDDPKQAWKQAATEAVDVVDQEGVPERTVHLSFGDVPGSEYLSQMITDHVIHSWDLARGIGADEKLDGELVDFVYAYMEKMAELWRGAGAFQDKVDVADDADKQTRLLALTGRST